jgi:hypothetical protein
MTENEKLQMSVASIICAETCGLTSDCKSREAAAALFNQGYLSRALTDEGLHAAMNRAAELGTSAATTISKQF